MFESKFLGIMVDNKVKEVHLNVRTHSGNCAGTYAPAREQLYRKVTTL